MKIADAMHTIRSAGGFRVHFERRADGLLHSDFFPDRDERPIADLEDAWRLATQWAAVDPAVYVNIYVIYALDWGPVEGYEARTLNRQQPPAEDAAYAGP